MTSPLERSKELALAILQRNDTEAKGGGLSSYRFTPLVVNQRSTTQDKPVELKVYSGEGIRSDQAEFIFAMAKELDGRAQIDNNGQIVIEFS
jgi:hypothetical protein